MSAPNATYPIANNTAPTGGVSALYYQCGGINWTGPTQCEAGSYCKEQNPFYFQCVAVEGTYPDPTPATASNAEYISTLLATGPASAQPTTLVTITSSSTPAPAAATPTAPAEDDNDDDEYCDDDATVTVSLAPKPTISAAAGGEDEDDYCEEEQ